MKEKIKSSMPMKTLTVRKGDPDEKKIYVTCVLCKRGFKASEKFVRFAPAMFCEKRQEEIKKNANKEKEEEKEKEKVT